MVPVAGLEPARTFNGPLDFKSNASAISPHRLGNYPRKLGGQPASGKPICSNSSSAAIFVYENYGLDFSRNAM